MRKVSSPLALNGKPFSPGREENNITRWLPERIEKILSEVLKILDKEEIIEEIRLRVNQPLQIRSGKGDYYLTAGGRFGAKEKAYIVTQGDLAETLEKMTYSSIYAAEEELRQGFLTLPGGHRVGISGEAVVEYGKIRTLRHVSGLNIRLARQPKINIIPILRLLLDKDKCFCHTLLLSPPRAGKTTILRTLVKHLSEGVPEIGLKGQAVGVVDERSEIAGMWQGIPAFDLGSRTDVLDRCPKTVGVNMLIRSMSPAVIAVDELGSREDAVVLREALRCGVKLLATAHAASLEELKERKILRDLLQAGAFQRAVILSRARGPGTVEAVYNLPSGNNLWKVPDC